MTLEDHKILIDGVGLDPSWPTMDKPSVRFEYDGETVLLTIMDRKSRPMHQVSITVDTADERKLIIYDTIRGIVLNVYNSFTGKLFKKDKRIFER